jgi:hypothetical protein
MRRRALLWPGNGEWGTGNGKSRQWPSVFGAPSFLRGCESIVGSCTRATWMPVFAGMTSGGVRASGGDGVQVRHGWSVALPERCPFSVPSFPRTREALFNGECRSSIVGPCTRAPWMPASAGMTSGEIGMLGKDGMLPGTPRLSGNGEPGAMRQQTLAPPRKPPARGLFRFPIPDSLFPAQPQ